MDKQREYFRQLGASSFEQAGLKADDESIVPFLNKNQPKEHWEYGLANEAQDDDEYDPLVSGLERVNEELQQLREIKKELMELKAVAQKTNK